VTAKRDEFNAAMDFARNGADTGWHGVFGDTVVYKRRRDTPLDCLLGQGGQPPRWVEPTYLQAVLVQDSAGSPVVKVSRAPWSEIEVAVVSFDRAMAVLRDPKQVLDDPHL